MASWDQKLCTAAKEGKINEVELCVKNRANLECRDELTVMSKTSPEVTPDTQLQEPAAPVVKDSIGKGQQSVMLNRLLGKGSYESFDMRCIVTGQFSVGKSTLVTLLAGDVIPDGRHPTDGISLVEGRCGLDIETKSWIFIDPEANNALDVVYNKMLMTSLEEEESELTKKFDQASDTSPTGYAKATLSSLPSEQSAAAQSLPPQKSSNVPLMVKQMKEKMKTRMTKEEIRRKMEKVLKSGKYKMKVGRLTFWDFGGQYVYLTTHQTFMTFRALFLVVFDGSKDLHEQVPDVLCFPGQHMTPTPAVFLQYWVNSILTYCKVVYAGIPKILFVATHKDKVPRENVETRREELYSGIEELFKDHEGQHHLVLRPLIFVNAKDQADPEIDVLKKTITELTFNHPCWGERMPNACVPLELEIAELVAEGKQFLSLAEVKELNAISEVSVLSPDQLTDFLHYQHSLGKIVYFDTPQLRDNVIISPLLMVEVMRSFITDVEFWPKEDETRKTFKKMSENGMIRREDLYQIWEQKEFRQILPFKEYIFDMLIHLDIVSEQRRYDTKTGSRLQVEHFFVPCMRTQRNDTDFLLQECTPERTVSLAFVFNGTILPPALTNRLICACLSMWTLKQYGGRKLMFSGFVGLSFDKEHDIVVCVEGNKILLHLVHKRSKGLIIPDIATSVRDCLFVTLKRISEFYQSSIHCQVSRKLPFHTEYSCSKLNCFTSENKMASKTEECLCEHGENIKNNWSIWNKKRKQKQQCGANCTGLSEDALSQIPSNTELFRLSVNCETRMLHDLALHLGMEEMVWSDLVENYPTNTKMVKFLTLMHLKENDEIRFSELDNGLREMEITPHKLCMAKGNRKRHSDISEDYIDLIPPDEILDKLAQVICVLSFQLGIELGLPTTSLDTIQYNNGQDLVAQCKDILFLWREDQRVKPTIGVLVQALVNVGRGSECLERIIKNVGVKKAMTESELLLFTLKKMEPNDFKIFIAHGEYESFENRVYLAGACNVGKSCLASILIGEKISKEWNSTNGLTIYFGRNGIHLEDRKMVTLGKSDTSIMNRLLLGNPNIVSKKELNVEKPVFPEQIDANEEATDLRASALKDKELKYPDQKHENRNPCKRKDGNQNVPIIMPENVNTNLPFQGTQLQDVNRIYPRNTAFSIQRDILEEMRTGEYKIKIAPSDLVDFGGQRCFDMTHQLFIQHKGTFVLMFDGRYELHTPLEEYPQGETGKDILVHWVNSILVYCKEDDDLLPMILFAATHSDCLEMDAMLAKERTFTLELAKLFSTHVKNRHILYDRVFFINATNSKDPQIEHLKEKLVDIAFQQSTWGQRMPISWVPLELQISEMRTKNFSVIQKETIQELNRLNDEFSLPEYLIDKFLRFQHSLGKILYFNIQGLDNFIVVQPTVMVNILRSFITDQMFWPEQQDLRSILENIANTGTVKKLQLFQLWSQPPFDVYLPTNQHKEYIINVLAHLDILVQPKYESKVKTSDPLYMVPSVVKTKLPVYLCPCEEQKTICLSYYLKECAIPSALTFKLIAAAVIVWPLKEIDGRPGLFFQSAILNIDDNNQLLIAIKGQRVIVYLTNKVSRYLISPDVAASIQECMTSALQRVLHFYHECFGQTPIKTDEVSLLEKEVGFICNQGLCLVSIKFAKKKKSWVCKNNQMEHDTKHCLYWIFEKQTNTCSKECKGLDVGTLSLRPNDQHLVRIAKQIPITIFDQFIIHLGLTREKWEEIEYQFLAKEGALGSKLMAMYELQNIKEIENQPVIFKDLSDALKEMDRPHYLCQILREDTKLIDIASSTLQEIPSDEILKKLPNELGNCTIQLGLELGLSFSRIQKTMSNNSKDMYKQLYDILNEWKISSKSRPSVLNLMKALQQTQSGGLKFLREQYKHN